MTTGAVAHKGLGQPPQPAQRWRPFTTVPSKRHWTGEVGPEEYANGLARLGDKPDAAISIYLHLPFCPVRCLYCGCHTLITHSSSQIDHYLDCLEQEMDLVLARIGTGRELLQLHVGGGTPNYLNDSQLVRLMEIIGHRFRVLGETEVSIECNPRKASAGQLALLRAIGFRRISFGVQDLQPDVQKAIGRIHSKELIRDVCGMARDSGFEYINLDLIYGLPYQTVSSFAETIASIIEMAPDRVSCFAYTHNPVSNPHQHALGTDHFPSRAQRLGLFQRAVDRFTESGYTWVGLDSFVLDTDDLAIAQDEHRLHRNCIGYTGGPTTYLISFGLGAVGDVDGILVQNAEHLPEWTTAVRRGALPISHGHHLDTTQRSRRDAILALICNLRISREAASDGLPEEFSHLEEYLAHGLVRTEGEDILLTRRGRFYLHSLCVEPDAELRHDRALWPLLQSI